jgi:hypothetical protein
MIYREFEWSQKQMAFFRHCITGIYSEANRSSPVGADFVPLISANYQKSEPFGYIIMAITALFILFNNIVFMRGFAFKPRQHFLWAFIMWGNCLFLFQLMLTISRYVNRLQLVIAIFHNSYELYLTYWNYLTIRGYINSPLDNKVPSSDKRVGMGDKIVIWSFSVLAFLLILSQLVVIILFDDLKYGIYAFYLILFGDTFFISSTVLCFILRVFAKSSSVKRETFEITLLFIAVLSHTLYAANNVLTCKFSVFTADIALVTNIVSIMAISACLYYVYKSDRSLVDDSIEYLPNNTFFCNGV